MSLSGMSAYVVALFSAAAVIVTHALRHTTSFLAAYIIFAICIVSCTTVTLCLVFLPKVSLLDLFLRIRRKTQLLLST